MREVVGSTVFLTVLALLATVVVTIVAPSGSAAPASDDAQASRGAAIYAFSCAACHGGGGQGFAEAVAAFPPDYQQCTRCHQPQNAAQMPGSQVGLSVMAFSLGDPPPLMDAERLARFGTAAGLYHYVRATMPRWAPGSLDDEAYLDVTSHLLRLAGLLADEEALSAAQLAGQRLE